ncbi:MAG TPA: PD-(D/E)XK nuclease family protein [archaeon]|nr:PD-(D/E)XK nuclease family protein [archaeon]
MPHSLSASTLSLFKDCPRCFWMHLRKKIKRPQGIFPSLPSGIDLVLKEHFDSYSKIGALPPELSNIEGKVQLFDDEKLLAKWRDFRSGLIWKDGTGNVLRGALDNLLVEDGDFIVLDYKTRGYPRKDDTHTYYQHQLDIYNLLLQKNGFPTKNYAYLLFYHPINIGANGHFTFQADLVKVNVQVRNAVELFEKALQTLDGQKPESSEQCSFCNWAKMHK